MSFFTNGGNDHDDDSIPRRQFKHDDGKSPPFTSTTPSSPSPHLARKGPLASSSSSSRTSESEEEMPEFGNFDSTYPNTAANDDHDDDDAKLFSSPPVTTPTRGGRKTLTTTPATKSPALLFDKTYGDNTDDSCNDDYYQRGGALLDNDHHPPAPPPRRRLLHEQNLEEALRLETQRREAAEQRVENLLAMRARSKDHSFRISHEMVTSNNIELSNDDWICIDKLLDRATNLLLAKNNNSHRGDDGPSEGDEEENDDREMHDQMQEYYELATAFYGEQKDHSELDGEEFVPREDIVWLLHELKWRYEEILTKYQLNREQRQRRYNIPSSDCCKKWKECVRDFADILKKVVHRHSPMTKDNDYGTVNGGEQPWYNAHQHAEENHPNNCQCIETMKQAYREQIANMSQLVSDLESNVSDQEERRRKLQEAIDEERRNFALSTEGNVARIRYLEGMVRSLEMDLKESRAVTNNNTRESNRIRNHEMPLSPPSRPVFMRDLTLDLMQDAEISTKDATNDDSDEIANLRNQITSLGNSLAESENERATLLDEFQKERLDYMMQFQQMSELLKQFTQGDYNHNT